MSDWPSQKPEDVQKGPVRPAAEQRDRDLRRLQGLQMLMERAAGASLPDLAAKYRLPENDIDEIMTDAWKEGCLDRLQEKLYTELGPLAMATYEAQLKMGSLDAARDVLGTIGVIQKPGQKAPKITVAAPNFAASQVRVQPIDSIENYRLARQSRSYSTRTRQITPGEDL